MKDINGYLAHKIEFPHSSCRYILSILCSNNAGQEHYTVMHVASTILYSGDMYTAKYNGLGVCVSVTYPTIPLRYA